VVELAGDLRPPRERSSRFGTTMSDADTPRRQAWEEMGRLVAKALERQID